MARRTHVLKPCVSLCVLVYKSPEYESLGFELTVARLVSIGYPHQVSGPSLPQHCSCCFFKRCMEVRGKHVDLNVRPPPGLAFKCSVHITCLNNIELPLPLVLSLSLALSLSVYLSISFSFCLRLPLLHSRHPPCLYIFHHLQSV